jgi:hypothetical protein
VCAWLAVASEAKSATVTFHADGYENVVRYVAAPGERNNLHIDHAGASVTLTDAGATLKAGKTHGARGTCERVDPHMFQGERSWLAS